jgi:hypothetical protein
VALNKKELIPLHLPDVDVIPLHVGSTERLGIQCPCDLRLTSEAARLAQYFYGSATISADKYEPLHVKNPYILACLVDVHGEFLGYFDVIPMKQSFAELFLQGTVTEKDLTHEHIFAMNEIADCKYVYISGIAAKDPQMHVGRRHASILLWGLLKYLDHFYGVPAPLGFATAATKEGENWLKKFEFDIRCEAQSRVDKLRMYALPISGELITRRLACIVDYNNICSLSWIQNSKENVGKSNRKVFRPHRTLRLRSGGPQRAGSQIKFRR